MNFSGTNSSPSDSSLLGDIDLNRLKRVIRKSLFWIILFISSSLITAWVYLRYTQPIYRAASVLKLDIKNQSGILGLPGYESDNFQELQTLSGEIELIKSKLIYQPLADSLNLYVSCFREGNFLNSELYNSSPVFIKYIPQQDNWPGNRFDLKIIDNTQFTLAHTVEGKTKTSQYSFGQKIALPEGAIIVSRSDQFSKNTAGEELYFIINNFKSVRKYVDANLEVNILNPSANTIEITFKDRHKKKAFDIVQYINKIYLERTIIEKTRSDKQILEFLDRQLAVIDDSLRTSESLLEKFSVKNKTVDAAGDAVKTLEQIDLLYAENASLRTRLGQLNDFNDQVLNQSENTPLPYSFQTDNSALSGLFDRLIQLRTQQEKLLTSYKENTAAVKIKQKEIETLESEITSLVSGERKEVLRQISTNRKAVGRLESSFYTLPSKSNESNRILRDYQLREQTYLMLMEKRAEFGMKMAGTVPEFEILYPPEIPNVPVSPRKGYTYLLCLAGGFMLSFLLTALRYVFYNTVSNQNELERITSLPILGTIPVFGKEKMPVSRSVVDKHPRSPVSEAFRSIRTNIEFLIPRQKNKILALTSSIGSEGKTFTTVNLGAVSALAGKKVIILDLDMRKPKLHLAFGTKNEQGMSNLLIGKSELKDCINSSSVDNLDFITAGPVPPNPSELILLPEFDTILETLKLHYDLIIADSPPAGLVTDGMLIMKKADLPIYVVRADYTARALIRNINKIGEREGFERLSIVLNAVDPRNTDTGYGYGYFDDENNGIASRWRRRGKKKSSVPL